jgi:hypothetical protein
MYSRTTLGPIACLCAAALTLLSCSAGEHMAAANAGVQKFREQAAKAQFAEIYNQSEPEMKKAAKAEELAKLLKTIAARLGAHQSSNQVGWHVNVGTGGTIVTLAYESTFEKGKGQEEFVFRIEDGVAHLVGYHINSNDLVTNKGEVV